MSFPWFPTPTNSVPPMLDNGAPNGSLTHSPPSLGGGTDSPGTSTHHAAAASGGFPSTSPYLSANVSQHSSESHSQSPHNLAHPNPSSFLPSYGENSLQQHLYASNRFGALDGGSSADQSFASPFGMSSGMLSQSYSMRAQGYPGMSAYGDASQQEMSRFNAFGASPYGAPGFDNYYNPFDGRAIPGASQTADSMLSAADRMIKGDPFENGMPRAGPSPWGQFGADSRDGLYLQAGYAPHHMTYGTPLGMFHPNSHYRPMGYDGHPFKTEMPDPYALTSSAMGSRFSPPSMMYMDKKSPKKKDSASPIPKPPSVDDSPTVPNKASRYFSERGIFTFMPPDMASPMSPFPPMISLADRYIMCQKMLCQRLADVDLPPKVTYVYNPLEYAFETHYKFVKKYYNSHKRVLFLGMNPGPFGMSQNGVPFGECNIVTDWMEIDGEVSKPMMEHPKRPVMGMECKRSEVSGARFWELFRRLCPTAKSFFDKCAIHNLCPLAFMTETGKNVAPSDMPVKVLRQLDSLCDQTFLDVVALFKVDHVITVGKYAYTCAQKALTAHNIHNVNLHCMMHPSPANPSANKGWADIAEGQLREFGVYNIIAVNPQPPPNQSQTQNQSQPQQSQPQQSQQQQQQQQQHQSPHHSQHQQQPPPHQQQHQPPTPTHHPGMPPHLSQQAHPALTPHSYPGNPYAHHPVHPHMAGYHHAPHHSPYAVPHVLQSTGIPMGMGGPPMGLGDIMGGEKRTHEHLGDPGGSSQKRVKHDES